MRQAAVVKPVNSIVFFADVAGGQVPRWGGVHMIQASQSCVVIGCRPEPDGPTEIVFGEWNEVDPNESPMFDGVVETPTCMVAITTVDQHTILQSSVPDARTRVRIWLNHPRWPDRVIIGLN